MNEQNYIVPPSNDGGGNDNRPVLSNAKSRFEKIGSWIKANKILFAASSLFVAIVILVGGTIITGKQISLFGLGLNPLYNKANYLECGFDYFMRDDCLNKEVPVGEEPGPITSTPTTPPVVSTPEYPIVEFQVGDANQSSPDLPRECSNQLSSWSVNGITIQPPTDDTIDCMRVRITNPAPSYSKDFRICYEVEGAGINCTPWASQGGAGPLVNSNGGFTNFHPWVEVQDLPAGKILQNTQVGSQLFYGNEGGGCGSSSGVAWAYGSGGSSESGWAYGERDDNDPGCVQVWLSGQVVDAPVAITINGNMSTGSTGQPYTQILNLNNDASQPCTWTLVSVEPNVTGAAIETIEMGLSASFTATPTTAGTYQVTLRADCQNGQTVTRTLEWVVNQGALATIDLSGSMPNGLTSTNYNYTYTAVGATSALTWSLENIIPSLSGASVNPSTGQFTALPLVATTYQVTVKASQADGASGTKTFTWIVDPSIEDPGFPPIPALNGTISGSMPSGTANQAYTYTYSQTGFNSSPTWTLVSVSPAISGASVNPSTGQFTATPTAPGTYQVTVRATGTDGGTDTEVFTWTVAAAPTPVVAPPPSLVVTPPATQNGTVTGTMNNGTAGQAYNYSYGATGFSGGVTWTLVSVSPAISGASVNPSTGQFTATPTAPGTYQVTIRATGPDGGTGTTTFNWTVDSASSSSSGGGGGSGGSSSSNTAGCMNSANLNKLTAIYRYWSPAYGDHLYTTNANEKPNGYRFEGIAGYVYSTQVSGTKPIYRSAQRQIGSHYYTLTNEDPTKYGYVDEGILGYAFETKVNGSDPWYRMHKGGATSDYVHTISESERTAVKEMGYVDAGIVAYLCGGSSATELQPVFRLWSAGDTDHFYTTNFAERDTLLTKGFISEGIAGYIYGVRKEGSAAIYRSYNSTLRDHFYTTSSAEALAGGYRSEGVMGYIATSKTSNTTAWYRLYNPKLTDHFYTSSYEEAMQAKNSGYVDEGILGYLYLSAK